MSGRTEIINIKNPSDNVLKILKKMQSRKEQRHTDFLNGGLITKLQIKNDTIGDRPLLYH